MGESLQLIELIAWPATTLVLAAFFWRPITSVFGLINKVEAGGVKIYLDKKKVEQIIEAGQKKKTPAGEIAEEILNATEIADQGELRILRALFDEEAGRLIVNYSRYYKPSLNNLLTKGYVHKQGDKYRLTDVGKEIAKRYLRNAIER